MDEQYQSDYKAKHSRETTLLKVQLDIAPALDDNCVVMLVVLDLSTVFDSVDQEQLMFMFECIIMGDFNHGHIQWNSLESTGIEDQQFLCLIQDSFLTQHVLEPTRGENVLDIVLSSQKELVDNVKIIEPLGNSDHNQIHFDINVKSESKNKKTYKRNFHKGNYKDMRKYLAQLDWNNMLMNKTAIEC